MAELAELLFACDIVVCPYKDATQSGVVMTAFSMQNRLLRLMLVDLVNQLLMVKMVFWSLLAIRRNLQRLL